MNRFNLFTRFLTLFGFTFLLLISNTSYSQTSIDFDKSFSPETIGPGSTTLLTLTITNNTGSAMENVAFTDNLPAGLLLANPANASTSCNNAILSAPDGGTTITLSNGRVGGNSSCTVSALVTGAASAGVYTNATSDLTFGVEGVIDPAAADLTIDDGRPGFSKEFSPSSINIGNTSTLTFTINNEANGSPVSRISFSDILPGDLKLASPSNFSTTCNLNPLYNTINAVAGSNVISISNFNSQPSPVVAAGNSCSISVDVVSSSAGIFVNTSDDLLTGSEVSSGKASAGLTVARPLFSKSFVNDPVAPDGSVQLDFTLRNPDNGDNGRPGGGAFTDISFTDTLNSVLSGLTLTQIIQGPCGTLSESGGVLSFSGGPLQPGSECTVSVLLKVPISASVGTYTNTTSELSYNAGGAQTAQAASDDLIVRTDPVLTKEFINDPASGGDDVTLRFTVKNTNQTSAATDVSFTDELTTFLPTPLNISYPDDPCGGGSDTIQVISIGVGGMGISLTNGTIPAGDSCTFDVTVGIPEFFPQGIYTNTTSEITATIDGETQTGKPATDNLIVVRAPSLVKVFGANQAAPGDTVDLTFTLEHDDNALGDATNISFSDDLDAALDSMSMISFDQGTCTGVISGNGTTIISYSGGSLEPDTSCSFTVKLSIPDTAKTGVFTNTTSVVTADVDVNGTSVVTSNAMASDVLEILSFTLTKEFTDDPVLPGDTVNLRFTFENFTGDNVTNIQFTDDLNEVISGMAAIGLPLNVCNGTISGATNLNFSGGSLGPNEVCQFDVSIQIPAGAEEAEYTNTTSVPSATINGQNFTAPPAVDDFIVANASNLLTLTKSFNPGSVDPGASAILDFNISFEGNTTASGISFTDNLNAVINGMTMTNVNSNTCGGTVSGTSTISFSGGTLSPGSSCDISVDVLIPLGTANDIYINNTSEITANNGSIVGDTATADLKVISAPDERGPLAVAGPDQSIECGNTVTLDGTGSIFFGSGPAYSWSEGGEEFATGATPTVTFAPGIHNVILTVSDDNGSDSDEVIITLLDDEAPSINLKTSVSLWPPNGKYVKFYVSDMVVDVVDNCDGIIPDTSINIISGSSDEPENGSGDGNTVNDIDIAPDCSSVQVRSERQGNGNGRVYTINLEVQDNSGNIGEASFIITVPKSKNGNPAVDDGPIYSEMCGSSLRSDILKNSETKFFVTPNPSSSEIFLSMEDFESQHPVIIEIYNISGQRVYSKRVYQEGHKRDRIDISGFQDGTYHILATQQEKQMNTVFIKVR